MNKKQIMKQVYLKPQLEVLKYKSSSRYWLVPNSREDIIQVK